jgi:hypothetical protein
MLLTLLRLVLLVKSKGAIIVSTNDRLLPEAENM